MSNKHRKSISKRMRSVSADMLSLACEVQKYSPENADQLEGASFMLLEWSEDILINEGKDD